MKNTMNEGQTQVYTDGGLDPTAGVNREAAYLNHPRQQLLDIIHVLFNQSGKMKTNGSSISYFSWYGNPTANGIIWYYQIQRRTSN